ncbi:hypothetical protein ACHAWF_013679 [Thalassiosira exigua]
MKVQWIAVVLFISLAARPASAENGAMDDAQLENLPGTGNALPAIGSNVNGDSVFTNYRNLRDNGQFFLFREGLVQYETPAVEVIKFRALHWCSNIEFLSDDSAETPTVGYTAKCLGAPLTNYVATAAAEGAQISNSLKRDLFGDTNSLSSVYVTQANAFETQMHKNTDNWIFRFFDDGRPGTSAIGWEVHDEGDKHPNMASSSFSAVGKLSWTTAKEVAELLKNNATGFTPEEFDKIYKDVWMSSHVVEVEVSNPYPEAELEVIEGVAKDNGTDPDAAAEDPVVEVVDGEEGEQIDNSSGGGRKLAVAIPGVFSTLLGFFQTDLCDEEEPLNSNEAVKKKRAASALACRFLFSPASTVTRWYLSQLDSHELRTKFFSSGALSAVGNVVAQKVTQRMLASTSGATAVAVGRLDGRRIFAMLLDGLLCTGPLLHS